MMKKILFTAALWSLVLLGGCAKGGSGPCGGDNCPLITVEGHSGGLDNVSTAGLNLTMTFTATFVHATQGPVNWNLTGTSCTTPTDSSNPCGYFTSTNGTTANYQAPSSVPSDSHFNVIATSQADGSLSGSLSVGIIPDVADVAPLSVNVGVGLKQQYTAVAVPDQAPQTFTWTCLASGVPCANFSQDPNLSGLAYYTPTSNEKCSGGGSCVVVSAIATIDPTGCSVDPKFPCNPSATTVVSDRVPTGTYAFQFSGYDKNGKAISVAGTFTVNSSGSISGYEDEWTAGGLARRAFSGGSYTPINGSDPNANNAGTLSLNTGAFPSTYQVVLDGAGDIQMIASDGAGDGGSGVAVSSAANKFNQGTNATFAFGFTGVDANNNRVGYVGLLPTDGVSSVTKGLIDVNDNGSATNSICNASSAPCTVTGSYAPDGTVSNLWHLTLTSPVAMTFDFFVANGNTTANNPLNLYAISTDSNPAVVGTMTLQNSKIAPYNNAALSGTSVSALTGANDNVALVLGTTDGTSSGTGGAGNFTGTFDWNNSGVITSVPPEVPCTATVCTFANTYVSTNNDTGRYTLQMLGTPNASPAGSPIPFVLYASGANRGYLLDPSSAAVITGTMNAQSAPKQNGGFFASSAATGTYAVATNSNSVSSIAPLTMNLLLTSPGAGVFNVTGVQNPNTQVSGSYTVGGSGNGAITLTAPAKSSYVIYGTTETTFFMIDLDSGVTSPMFYMAQ